MKGEILFVILLGALLFISGVQAVELMKISDKISGVSVNNNAGNTGAYTTVANTQNIPDMVGSC